MDPVTIGLSALQMGGQLMSIFGKKTRKSIDPNWLKQTFGAGAVNEELMSLYNRAINSTQGQALLTGAARSGQQFQTDVARQSAAAGLGAAGGATGGADIFASAGAGQAAGNLQTGIRASLMQSMLPVAEQMVAGRMGAYMQGEQLRASQPYEPSPWSQFGDLMEKYGSAGLASYVPSSGGTTKGSSSEPVNDFPGFQPGQTPVVGPTAQKPGLGTDRLTTLPSMRDVGMYTGPKTPDSGFRSKMSRFSGASSAVQPTGRFN